MNRLEILLDNVIDEESFMKFIRALHDDSVKMRNEWENLNVSNYFESCIAWVEDTRKNPKYAYDINPWKRCATILYVGKIYE